MKNKWKLKIKNYMQDFRLLKNITKGFWNFITPIIYLFIWISMLRIAKEWLGGDILNNSLFLIISLAIMFMGVISKSTSWSIGGDKGIKGDSISKRAEFCVDGICTIKVSDNEPEVKEKLMLEMGKIVIDIAKNTKGKDEK